MRILTFTILIITIAYSAFGQPYEPKMIILTPDYFTYEKTFEEEIKAKNKELSEYSQNSAEAAYLKSDEFKSQPKNIQQMVHSQLRFSENLYFQKETSYMAYQYLTYRFYERFTNLLILLMDIKSNGSLADSKSIAEKQKMQYVLNFSKIELFKKKKTGFVRISVQLYDNISQTFLINKDYEGDWTNPGFEFACADKSIECTINNALSKALNDVIVEITSNSPTIRLERELTHQQLHDLITNHYSKPYDENFLSNIILQPDSNIVLADQYHLLTNSEKDKFVAFFIKQVSAQDFKALTDNTRDRNVNIISSKDIKDEGFLDEIPQTYAYIVKGVRHNEKWFYEKANVTYFGAKNLEEGKQMYFLNLVSWDFFQENSTAFNPYFWESNFFSKVESSFVINSDRIEELTISLENAKTQEEKEIYQDMLEDYHKNDLKNKPYFGLYDIVANQKKAETRKQNELFSQSVKSKFLTEFYNEYCRENNIQGFDTLYVKQLIFPSNKSYILSPIVLDHGKDKKELNYFLLIPKGENSYRVFKWNYFKPIIPKYSHYGSEIVEQLNQITIWNFSFDFLDDNNFWDKYVLLKVDGEYKYLTEI